MILLFGAGTRLSFVFEFHCLEVFVPTMPAPFLCSRGRARDPLQRPRSPGAERRVHRLARTAPSLLALALSGCFIAPSMPPAPAVPDAASTPADASSPVTTPPVTTPPPFEEPPASWPAFGATTAYEPACAKLPVIDGKISGTDELDHEWRCAGSVTGRFGRLYVLWDGLNLYAANDWRLRTDAPTCPEMFNAFWLGTPVGFFTLRVYGDNHMEVWRDGVKIAPGKGAAGFGPSINMAKPHAMYEFRLTIPNLPPAAGMWLGECDPAGNLVTQGGPVVCGADAAPMVMEPMMFSLKAVQTGGKPGVTVAAAPKAKEALGSVEPKVLVPGQTAIVRAKWAGATQGLRLRVGDVEISDATWFDDCVIFTVPVVVAGVTVITVERNGSMSRPLQVQVAQ